MKNSPTIRPLFFGIVIITILGVISLSEYPLTGNFYSDKHQIEKKTLNISFSGNWTQIYPAVSPERRDDANMMYDSVNNRTILFSGDPNFDDTWEFNFVDNTWFNLNPIPHPPRLSYTSMVSIGNGNGILFGGNNDVYPLYYNDTWMYCYDNNSWVNQNPESAPYSRSGCKMAFVSSHDKIILFGGRHPIPGDLGDTWEYNTNSNQWTNISTEMSPSNRKDNGITYDSVNNKIILFGGVEEGSEILGDMWEYDPLLQEWSELFPINSPPERKVPGLVYDSEHEVVILFGGWGVNGPLNDLWVYDYDANNWFQIITDIAPSKRYVADQMVFDSRNNKTIIFGGYNGSDLIAYEGDTWHFTLVDHRVSTSISTTTSPSSTSTSIVTSTTSETSETSETSKTTSWGSFYSLFGLMGVLILLRRKIFIRF